MKPEIRKKDMERGIKVLDKTIVGAEHVKRSHSRTKEAMESVCQKEEISPEAYAQDQMMERGKAIVLDIPYQTERSVKTIYRAGKKLKRYIDIKEYVTPE